MPAHTVRLPLSALALCAVALVAGCGTIDGATQRLAGSITPYRVQVVQGNFVSKEQVEALRPGMNRQQVRDILGTPLVASVFHADRWDYVFTLRRQGVEPQARKLTVYFKGNELERHEGDAMPSEAEFVAMLDTRRKSGAVPLLEASEESLRKYGGAPSSVPATPSADAPVAPVNYPPLEAGAR